jgi:putative intracellular protease/amidase
MGSTRFRKVKRAQKDSATVLRLVTYKSEPLVKGKRVTGFTNGEGKKAKVSHVVPFLVENELVGLGAVFEKLRDCQPLAITDGRLITGQNPAFSMSAAKVLLQFLARLVAS